MIESLKHTIYAGLGATVLTVEKIEASLQELVEKGKISADEARETARKISEESKKEFKDARSSLEKSFEEMLGKAPVARSKDIEAINKRLDSIEKSIAKLSKSDS
jgi:polyhydroxyalkanoate synthesis regulator phasin